MHRHTQQTWKEKINFKDTSATLFLHNHRTSSQESDYYISSGAKKNKRRSTEILQFSDYVHCAHTHIVFNFRIQYWCFSLVITDNHDKQPAVGHWSTWLWHISLQCHIWWLKATIIWGTNLILTEKFKPLLLNTLQLFPFLSKCPTSNCRFTHF